MIISGISHLERVLKSPRAVRVQGARSEETGAYRTYMKISSNAATGPSSSF
jgi:hypothetical protein